MFYRLLVLIGRFDIFFSFFASSRFVLSFIQYKCALIIHSYIMIYLAYQ